MSHDVSALIMMLEDHGEDFSKFSNLEDYTLSLFSIDTRLMTNQRSTLIVKKSSVLRDRCWRIPYTEIRSGRGR